MLVRRQLLVDGGGIDPLAGDAWVLDFLLRTDRPSRSVADVGVRRRFPDRRRALRPAGNQRNAVLNRHLVDWPALESRQPQRGLTSVVIPTYEDAELTTACVDSVLADQVRRRRGGGRGTTGRRGRSPTRSTRWPTATTGCRSGTRPRTTASRSATTSALQEAHGDVVVFLNNDTTVSGRLAGSPARGARGPGGPRRPAAPRSTRPGRSSRRAWPSRRPEDCRTTSWPASRSRTRPGSTGLRFHALTGAALAMRFEDAVAMRGFDPVFTNGMEDVDLCQRLAAHCDRATSGWSPTCRWSTTSPGPRAATPGPCPTVRSTSTAGRAATSRATTRPSGPPAVCRSSTTRSGRPGTASHPRFRDPAARPRPRAAPGPGADPALGAEEPGARRTRRRALGRHPLRRLPGRRAARARPGGRHRPASRVRPPHRPPRRRRAGPARPGAARPEPRAGVAALGHLAPRRGGRARGPRLRPGRRRGRGLGRAAHPRVGDAGRHAAPGHRPRAVPPGRGRARQRRTRSCSSATRAGSCVPSSATPSPPASRSPSTATSGPAWSPTRSCAGRSIPNRRLAAAYAGAGVVLNDHWDDMRAGGFVSNRLFDAVASGARVVSGRRGRAAEGCSATRSRSTGTRRPRAARDAARPGRGVRRRRRPAAYRRAGPDASTPSPRAPRRWSSSPTRPAASAGSARAGPERVRGSGQRVGVGDPEQVALERRRPARPAPRRASAPSTGRARA